MRLLKWLRIVDSHDGRLSLSALAFISSWVLACVGGSWERLALAALATGLYAHRRTLVHRGEARAEALTRISTNVDLLIKGHTALQDLQDKHDQRLAAVENRVPRLR